MFLTEIISDFGTFLYLVQPCLCLWTVFSSFEKYLDEVYTNQKQLCKVSLIVGHFSVKFNYRNIAQTDESRKFKEILLACHLKIQQFSRVWNDSDSNFRPG